MALLTINRFPDHIQTRFWGKVEILSNDRCWAWRAGCDKDGYGKFGFTRDGVVWHLRSHRISLVLSGSDEPFDGAVAMHSCDNPRCCNPHHLKWGDARENAKDCVQKGRSTFQVYGIKPPVNRHNGKFSASEVRHIRAALKCGESQRSVARRMCVDKSTIKAIMARDTYRHVL